MTNGTPSAPAGWYPSPSQPGQNEYWDGQRWTGQVAPIVPPAPAPAPMTAPAPAGEDKKPLWKRKIMWPVYGFIGLIVIVAAAGGGANDPDVEANAATAVDDVESEEPAVEEPQEEPTPDADAVGTRANPVRLGDTATFTLDALGDADGSVWTLTVTGPATDGTQAVADGNQFNSPPEDGNVFVFVPISLTLDSANKEPLGLLFNMELELFSPTNATIADSTLGCGFAAGVDNLVDTSTEVFIGGSIVGNLCVEVPATDLGAGMLVTTDSVEGDRLFLAAE